MSEQLHPIELQGVGNTDLNRPRRTRVGIDVTKDAFSIVSVEQVLHIEIEPDLVVDLVEAQQVDDGVATHRKRRIRRLPRTLIDVLEPGAQPQPLERALLELVDVE